MPIADRHQDYCDEIKKQLLAKGIRCEVDYRSEKIGYKIREAQLEKIPYMLVIGDKDIEAGTLSVRSRKEGDKGAFTLDDFTALILEKVESKELDY